MAMGRGRLNGPELRRASGWKPRTEESELFGEMGDEDGDDFEDAKERSFQSNLMNIRPMSVRVRNITIYLAKKYCDLTLAEIGKFWGLDYSTVSLSAKRMEIQLAHDSALAEIIRRVEEILGVRSQHLNN